MVSIGCAHPDGTPEVREVLGLGHALEDKLPRCVEDAGDDELGGCGHGWFLSCWRSVRC